MIVAFIANLIQSSGTNQMMSCAQDISECVHCDVEGNTYPNPDDTNPTTRDTVNISEAPVGVHGDDRRDELSKAERGEEGHRRTLHEKESVRTRDEDEGLRDDGNLEVDDRMKTAVVVVRRLDRAVLEDDTELVVEESRLDADGDEGDRGESEVQTVCDSI